MSLGYAVNNSGVSGMETDGSSVLETVQYEVETQGILCFHSITGLILGKNGKRNAKGLEECTK
jgi:hypothetical protein